MPVSISSAGGKEVTKVMLERDEVETVVRLPGVAAGEWIKLNPGVVGFYRSGGTLALHCTARHGTASTG